MAWGPCGAARAWTTFHSIPLQVALAAALTHSLSVRHATNCACFVPSANAIKELDKAASQFSLLSRTPIRMAIL